MGWAGKKCGEGAKKGGGRGARKRKKEWREAVHGWGRKIRNDECPSLSSPRGVSADKIASVLCSTCSDRFTVSLVASTCHRTLEASDSTEMGGTLGSLCCAVESIIRYNNSTLYGHAVVLDPQLFLNF
jgi:hypothetical protein